MKKGFQDYSPSVSLTVLGTLCFITLVLCQTRFKVSKEMSREIYPPVVRSKDCWFLYTIGNPDRFKCVLRAFVVITSPILSFISTALLLFGKTESNPYFFIPWLFLTIKGLLLVQTDNLITIIRDMGNRANFAFGFRVEDLKWLLFYGSIFIIDLVEVFSFCEIFDLFLVLWNHHPGYNVRSANLEAVKKEIAEIMEALSKCSLGSLSKISLGSVTDSEGTHEGNMKRVTSIDKFSLKEEKIFYDKEPAETLSKFWPQKSGSRNNNSTMKNFEDLRLKNCMRTPSIKSMSEGDASTIPAYEIESLIKTPIGDLNEFHPLTSPELQPNPLQKTDFGETSKHIADCFPLKSYD